MLFVQLDDEAILPELDEIFSLRLKYSPSKCLAFGLEWISSNPGRENTLTSDTITTVVNNYWSAAVEHTIASIWRLRVDKIYNSTAVPVAAEREAVFQSRLQASFTLVATCFELDTTNASKWAVAMETRKRLRQQEQEVPAYDTRNPRHTMQYIGFFDGGILIEINDNGTPRVLWIRSMSIGNVTCTNNAAEFRGLQSLLHFISSHKLDRVHIVGGSQLILKMMSERRRPRAK